MIRVSYPYVFVDVSPANDAAPTAHRAIEASKLILNFPWAARSAEVAPCDCAVARSPVAVTVAKRRLTDGVAAVAAFAATVPAPIGATASPARAANRTMRDTVTSTVDGDEREHTRRSDTDDVLRSAGFDEARIAALRAAGALARAAPRDVALTVTDRCERLEAAAAGARPGDEKGGGGMTDAAAARALDFGVTVILDPPHDGPLRLLETAEACGFAAGWVFDSPVISEEPYPLLGLAAARTSRIRLGLCVTNPATRDITVTASAHATLHEITGGRMVIGLGRGDSAVHMVGLEPVRVAAFEQAVVAIRELANGRAVTLRGTEVQFPWAGSRPELPVYVAAYGPKALAVAGRVADGVIIQLADPDIVAWLLGFVRRAAAEAGRDPDAIECIVSAPAVVSDDLPSARDSTRFFPAMVSNHVLDLLRRYDRSELPPALWEFVERRQAYDYRHHARTGSDNGAFVDDVTADRFSILGPVSAHLEKLRELQAAGATQINLYLLTPEPESLLEIYGREIVPVLGGGAA